MPKPKKRVENLKRSKVWSTRNAVFPMLFVMRASVPSAKSKRNEKTQKREYRYIFSMHREATAHSVNTKEIKETKLGLIPSFLKIRAKG